MSGCIRTCIFKLFSWGQIPPVGVVQHSYFQNSTYCTLPALHATEAISLSLTEDFAGVARKNAFDFGL